MQNKDKTKECYSCGGKGFYTQMHGQHASDDFDREGYEIKPTIHKYPCSACNGTGRKIKVVPPKETSEEEYEEDAWEGKHCPKCNLDFKGIGVDSKCAECEEEFEIGEVTPDSWEKQFDERWKKRDYFDFGEQAIKSFIRRIHKEAYNRGKISGIELMEMTIEHVRKTAESDPSYTINKIFEELDIKNRK